MGKQRFPKLVEGIEQPSDVFLNRMHFMEKFYVGDLVSNLQKFMGEILVPSYLIAGVGGILRNDDPQQATDIDIAVVGFKYTLQPAKEKTHTKTDANAFTHIVKQYFDYFSECLDSCQVDPFDSTKTEKRDYPTGNRHIVGTRGVQLERLVDIQSDFSGLNPFGAIGFEICYENLRPLNVQFVFNKTQGEWKSYQKSFTNPYDPKDSAPFYYAILAEKKPSPQQRH